MKNEIPEIRTETRISIQKLSIFIFAAYHLNMMACSIYTDSLIGWSGTLYYVKILMMVLGYAAFYGSRKAVGSTTWRKYLLIASNVIYSAGLLLLMIIDNIVMITGISLMAMFVLGYVGGAVYYFLSLRVSGIAPSFSAYAESSLADSLRLSFSSRICATSCFAFCNTSNLFIEKLPSLFAAAERPYRRMSVSGPASVRNPAGNLRVQDQFSSS